MARRSRCCSRCCSRNLLAHEGCPPSNKAALARFMARLYDQQQRSGGSHLPDLDEFLQVLTRPRWVWTSKADDLFRRIKRTRTEWDMRPAELLARMEDHFAQMERRGRRFLKKSVVSQYAHLSVADAAKELGVAQATLKKACQAWGIERWPGHLKKQEEPADSRAESMVVNFDAIEGQNGIDYISEQDSPSDVEGFGLKRRPGRKMQEEPAA